MVGKNRSLRSVVLGALCSASIVVFPAKNILRDKKEWKKLQPLYTVKAYESVTDDYAALYPVLNYEPKFIFEYGMILNAAGQREKADSVFNRGLEKSSDPMFYNVKGRNYHEMGEYDKAEKCYINST